MQTIKELEYNKALFTAGNVKLGSSAQESGQCLVGATTSRPQPQISSAWPARRDKSKNVLVVLYASLVPKDTSAQSKVRGKDFALLDSFKQSKDKPSAWHAPWDTPAQLPTNLRVSAPKASSSPNSVSLPVYGALLTPSSWRKAVRVAQNALKDSSAQSLTTAQRLVR